MNFRQETWTEVYKQSSYPYKQDISNFFDKYIYQDEKAEKIVTTYDKKIAEIGFDENEINISEEIIKFVEKKYPNVVNYAIKRYVRINVTCISKVLKYDKNIEWDGNRY